MSTPLKPIGSNIILKVLLEPEQTSSGIILPDESRERSYRAEVVAVGDGYATPDGGFRPLTVKPGDEVVYARFSGTTLKHGSEEYVIVAERDIHAIIQQEGFS